jgi:hypothetical protein
MGLHREGSGKPTTASNSGAAVNARTYFKASTSNGMITIATCILYYIRKFDSLIDRIPAYQTVDDGNA